MNPIPEDILQRLGAQLQERKELRLGELAIQQKILTRSQLQECLDLQRNDGESGRLPLQVVLLQQGFLTAVDLQRLNRILERKQHETDVPELPEAHLAMPRMT